MVQTADCWIRMHYKQTSSPQSDNLCTRFNSTKRKFITPQLIRKHILNNFFSDKIYKIHSFLGSMITSLPEEALRSISGSNLGIFSNWKLFHGNYHTDSLRFITFAYVVFGGCLCCLWRMPPHPTDYRSREVF